MIAGLATRRNGLVAFSSPSSDGTVACLGDLVRDEAFHAASATRRAAALTLPAAGATGGGVAEHEGDRGDAHAVAVVADARDHAGEEPPADELFDGRRDEVDAVLEVVLDAELSFADASRDLDEFPL